MGFFQNQKKSPSVDLNDGTGANHIKPPALYSDHLLCTEYGLMESTCWMTDNAGHTW